MSENKQFIIRGIVIGNNRVGREHLLQRLCNGMFITCCFGSSVEDKFHKYLKFEDKIFDVMLLKMYTGDTPKFIQELCIKQSNFYIIAYAINDSESLENVWKYREDIYEVLKLDDHEEIPLILCATKLDLERNVSSHEEIKMMKKCGTTLFYTSAKNNIGVQEMGYGCVANYFKILKKKEKENNKRLCLVM
ncbi:hypothetical protein EIN_346100 [Entamoeba invadens IP1]|uniref:Uncharacterized protein n=1 Tax=Entamoeba invadens IP1 TaxID=370355 RepID=L7FJW2_ENTIV|nr:hypothetical protein EIN_346100 [Entamoeba invadens IP1]ELP84013.1 hypothetical protein EIN_346100 [Entamoeba invadens IP1]|eukprot:XP_004183359.1 hypothetical protein EIN_346100 [Entamoeba invadens IP1]